MEVPSKQLPDEAIFVLISFVLLTLHLFSLSPYIGSLIQPVSTPLMTLSEDVGTSISGAFSAISEINSVRQERNDLLIDNAFLKAENSNIKFLLDEIQLLKEELALSPEEEFRIEAEVLSDGHETMNEYLVLNKGTVNGVKAGDIVRKANIFIGVVDDVSRGISRVDLPTSGQRYWKVIVVSKNPELLRMPVEELAQLSETGTDRWSGVAIGKDTGIVVQNITNNSSVKVGDMVFVNDSDVSDILYLGEVGAIDYDPAAVGIEVAVRIPFQYDMLTNLFIIRPGG